MCIFSFASFLLWLPFLYNIISGAPCLDEGIFNGPSKKCADVKSINCNNPENHWSYQKCGRFCKYCGQGEY